MTNICCWWYRVILLAALRCSVAASTIPFVLEDVG